MPGNQVADCESSNPNYAILVRLLNSPCLFPYLKKNGDKGELLEDAQFGHTYSCWEVEAFEHREERVDKQ